MPAAFGAAPVARSGRRTHPDRARSAFARDQGVSRSVHAFAGLAHLHGWPAASAGMGAAHLERILHGRVDRKHAKGDDDTLEGWLYTARWPADHRCVHHDRLHNSAW